jgi:hypothetical protein
VSQRLDILLFADSLYTLVLPKLSDLTARVSGLYTHAGKDGDSRALTRPRRETAEDRLEDGGESNARQAPKAPGPEGMMQETSATNLRCHPPAAHKLFLLGLAYNGSLL